MVVHATDAGLESRSGCGKQASADSRSYMAEQLAWTFAAAPSSATLDATVDEESNDEPGETSVEHLTPAPPPQSAVRAVATKGAAALREKRVSTSNIGEKRSSSPRGPLARGSSRSSFASSPAQQVETEEARQQREELERRKQTAARMIQRNGKRFLLRCQGKGFLALWPSIHQLRGAYMDEAAVKAGAEDNPLYSDEMIVAREALKRHPDVLAALEYAWNSFIPEGETMMSRKMYLAMSRRLYLVRGPAKGQPCDGRVTAV